MKEFKRFAKKYPTYSVEQIYHLIKVSSKSTLRTFYDWLCYGLIDCLQYKRRRNNKAGLFNDIECRKNIKQRAVDFGVEEDDYSKSGHYEIGIIIDGFKMVDLLRLTIGLL